jgi:hypothetical protein
MTRSLWSSRLWNAYEDAVWHFDQSMLMAKNEEDKQGMGQVGQSGANPGKGKGKAAQKGKGKGQASTNCACCGSLGHAKRDCYHLAKTCHGCGQKGHLVHVCQKMPRPSLAPKERVPGDGSHHSYAAAVSDGPRPGWICQTCFSFQVGTSNVCQKVGCQMKRRSDQPQRQQQKAPQQPQDAAHPVPSQTDAQSREEEALLAKIQRVQDRIAGCREDGVNTQGLEESLRKLQMEVPPPVTPLSAAVLLRDRSIRGCQIHKTLAEQKKRFDAAVTDADRELAKMLVARKAQFAQLEEDYQARVNNMTERFDELASRFARDKEDARERHEEKVKTLQSQLESFEAADSTRGAEPYEDRSAGTAAHPQACPSTGLQERVQELTECLKDHGPEDVQQIVQTLQCLLQSRLPRWSSGGTAYGQADGAGAGLFEDALMHQILEPPSKSRPRDGEDPSPLPKRLLLEDSKE